MSGIVKKFKRIFNFPNTQKQNYDTWTTDMRVERMQNDIDFKNHCQHLLIDHPNLEEEMKLWERIARIKIDNPIDYDNYQKQYVEYYILQREVFKFYVWLDTKFPKDYGFVNKALENLAYFTCVPRVHDERSNTSRGEYKRIFVNLHETDNYIGNKRTAVHEFGHSFEKSFDGTPYFDDGMREVCSCIIDNLYFEFAKEAHPDEADAIKCDQAFYLANNIEKAKKTLFEAHVVKVMNGQATFDDLKNDYGDLYSEEYIRRRLRDVETFKFGDLHEGRYLIPQAIAKAFVDKFHENPEQAVRNLKGVMAKNTDLKLDDAIAKLGLNKKNILIDDFVDTLNDRYSGLSQVKTEEKTIQK